MDSIAEDYTKGHDFSCSHNTHTYSSEKGSTHSVRIDLKARNSDWLEEAATKVSKSFGGERIDPLTWDEIIAKTGRTDAEIAALQQHVENGNGTVESVCPSKLCVFAHLGNNVTTSPDEQAFLLQAHLRRSLLALSDNDESTMVRGVQLLSVPESEDEISDELVHFMQGDMLSPDRRMLSALPNFPGNTFTLIYNTLLNTRTYDEANTTLNDLNRLSFFSFPVFCYSVTQQVVPLEGGTTSCPQTVKIYYQVWETDAFNFSAQIQELTLQTSNLPSQSCESILGPGNCDDEKVAFKSGTGNATLTVEWRNDTAIKMIDWASHLPLGLTYEILDLEFSDGLVFQLDFYDSYISLGPTITPSYANKIYGIPEGHQGAGLGITALYVPGDSAYSQKALQIANHAFNLPTPTIELFTSKLFPGMNTSECYLSGQDCGESNLDVQMLAQYGVGAQFGFIPSDRLTLSNQSLSSNFEQFVGYRESFIEKNLYPDVLSLSWGDLASYDTDLNDILKAFSAAGITVLVATGDRGAIGDQGCNSFVGNVIDQPLGLAMYPWILAVGATQQAQLPGQNGHIGTVACMGPTSLSITSTGRIFSSAVIPMPGYQADAIAEYLNSSEFKSFPYPPRTIPSPGRGIPDVSAFGAFIPDAEELQNGTVMSEITGGTSASAPAFAGLLLQVRGALLQRTECANKTIKFGHINPMIYWMARHRPAAFVDITIGNNVFDGQMGITFDLSNCGQGFAAAHGWDPVTGVGMMNFTGFVDAAVEYMCVGIETSNFTSNVPSMVPTMTVAPTIGASGVPSTQTHTAMSSAPSSNAGLPTAAPISRLHSNTGLPTAAPMSRLHPSSSLSLAPAGMPSSIPSSRPSSKPMVVPTIRLSSPTSSPSVLKIPSSNLGSFAPTKGLKTPSTKVPTAPAQTSEHPSTTPSFVPHSVCSGQNQPCRHSSDCCSSKLGCFGKKNSKRTCQKCAQKNDMCSKDSPCCQNLKKFKCDRKKKKCVACLKSGAKCTQSKKCCSNKCVKDNKGRKKCTKPKK